MSQDPTTEPGLLDSTAYLLARVGAGSRRLWARMLAAHDLTPHHFGILMVLDQAGTATQQQLSRAVGIDPRNAVPVLDALEQRDLIRREPDPGDRRRHAVALTAAGRAAIRELRRAGDEVQAQLLDVLSPPERSALHQSLSKLLAALDG